MDARIKHGRWGTPEYKSWDHMKQRCLNSNQKVYNNYGGRGIKICKNWLQFEKFYRDMGERPKGTTLDRINNNGNYEPSNCRWATWEQQMANRGLNGNNKSGITGISWRNRKSPWRANIMRDHKLFTLGSFGTKEEAIMVRLKAQKEFDRK